MIDTVLKFLYTIMMFIANKVIDIWSVIFWFIKFFIAIAIMAVMVYAFFSLCGWVLCQISVVHNFVSTILPIFKSVNVDGFLTFTLKYFSYGCLTVSVFFLTLIISIGTLVSSLAVLKWLFITKTLFVFWAFIDWCNKNWKKASRQAEMKFSKYHKRRRFV